jgi:hypothetical protein
LRVLMSKRKEIQINDMEHMVAIHWEKLRDQHTSPNTSQIIKIGYKPSVWITKKYKMER